MKRLSLCLLLSAFLVLPANRAAAYDIQVDGLCYNLVYDAFTHTRSAVVTFQNIFYGVRDDLVPSGYVGDDAGDSDDGYGFTDYHESDYRGEVCIPSSVSYDGETYVVRAIGPYAFENCLRVSSVDIPSTVVDIGEKAFRNCGALSISWHTTNENPSSYTLLSLGDEAFSMCGDLTSMDIPLGVTAIGWGTFSMCSRLTSLTLPATVARIGDWACWGCTALATLNVGRSTPPAASYWSIPVAENVALVVPPGCRPAYEASEFWSGFGSIREAGDTPLLLTIPEAGYATFCASENVDFTGLTDVKAYIASGYSRAEQMLVLTQVGPVPAAEGLFLVGKPGTYEVPRGTSDVVYSNLLRGVTRSTVLEPAAGEPLRLVFDTGGQGLFFYPVTEATTLPSGTAFLQLPASVSSAEVQAVGFVVADGTVGVDAQVGEDRQTAVAKGVVCDLSGRRLPVPTGASGRLPKGIYVVNGRKSVRR